MNYCHTPIVRMSTAVDTVFRVEKKILAVKELEKEITGRYEMSTFANCDPESWVVNCTLNIYPTGISSDAKATEFEICSKVKDAFDRAPGFNFLKETTGKPTYWTRKEWEDKKRKTVTWMRTYDMADVGNPCHLTVWIQESYRNLD